MKVSVITTIAQHYKGANLHFANLRWALEGLDYKIYVQTFSEFKIESEEDLQVINVNKNPDEFYFFWDHTNELLADIIDETDVFLFMEQDILFTEQPISQIHKCLKKQALMVNMESEYLAIFNSNRKKLYPRMWEGGLFVPKSVIKKALDENITFGSHNFSLFKEASSHYTVNLKRQLITVREYIDTEPFFDTLFEFSFFCFCKQFPWISMTGDLNYEYGKQLVHFRAIEMVVHDDPTIYNDLSRIEMTHRDLENLRSGCCLMLLLSGAHERSSIMSKYFRRNALLERKIEMLLPTAKYWMTPQQWSDLLWARKSIAPKVLL